jgi:hypothetical protein
MHLPQEPTMKFSKLFEIAHGRYTGAEDPDAVAFVRANPNPTPDELAQFLHDKGSEILRKPAPTDGVRAVTAVLNYRLDHDAPTDDAAINLYMLISFSRYVADGHMPSVQSMISSALASHDKHEKREAAKAVEAKAKAAEAAKNAPAPRSQAELDAEHAENEAEIASIRAQLAAMRTARAAKKQ